MILQTTWQGCDSSLTAPLVPDLAARAHQRDLPGPQGELGFYCKDPVGKGPSGLGEQYAALVTFAERLRAKPVGGGKRSRTGGRSREEQR
ncbi:hypothetical protein [Streptomyces sp. NPDC005303]|uniref:hypothetical protein n=1 Tax=Streptomyces sp. NPDC005303 TaxID=3155713 RepID=UPI0033BDD62E